MAKNKVPKFSKKGPTKEDLKATKEQLALEWWEKSYTDFNSLSNIFSKPKKNHIYMFGISCNKHGICRCSNRPLIKEKIDHLAILLKDIQHIYYIFEEAPKRGIHAHAFIHSKKVITRKQCYEILGEGFSYDISRIYSRESYFYYMLKDIPKEVHSVTNVWERKEKRFSVVSKTSTILYSKAQKNSIIKMNSLREKKKMGKKTI